MTMAKQLAFSLIFLAFIGYSLHVVEEHELALVPTGRFKLQASNGEYLNLCISNICPAFPPKGTVCTSKCGPVVTPGVGVAYLGPLNGDNSVWTFAQIGNQVSILGNNGKFLARCNGCMKGGSTPDFAFVHVATSDVA